MWSTHLTAEIRCEIKTWSDAGSALPNFQKLFVPTERPAPMSIHRATAAKGVEATTRARATRCRSPPDSALPLGPQWRIPTIGKSTDHFPEICNFDCPMQFFMRSGGLPQEQIVFERSIEKDGILHEIGDSSSKTLQPYIANVDAVDIHRSAVRVVQPSDQLCNGALATATDPDERDLLAGL